MVLGLGLTADGPMTIDCTRQVEAKRFSSLDKLKSADADADLLLESGVKAATAAMKGRRCCSGEERGGITRRWPVTASRAAGCLGGQSLVDPV